MAPGRHCLLSSWELLIPWPPRCWKHASLPKRAPDSPSLTSEPPKQLMAKEWPQAAFLPTGTPGPCVRQHQTPAPRTPTSQPFPRTKQKCGLSSTQIEDRPAGHNHSLAGSPQTQTGSGVSPAGVPAPTLQDNPAELSPSGLPAPWRVRSASLLGS